MLLSILALGIVLASGRVAGGGEVLVAVAANFTTPAKQIAAAFAAIGGDRARLSFGSTGKLYTQIAHGAPFEVFLAADSARPARAEIEGLAVPGSRFTYARGRIALWSADARRVDPRGEVLRRGDFSRIAIANPKTAPYGAVAIETLTRLGLYDRLRGRMVQGENIAQTYQFVATGNAELGFVAVSQLVDTPHGSRWVVPTDLYRPIDQQAVLLKRGADNPVAAAFLDFLRTDAAAAVMDRYGYGD